MIKEDTEISYVPGGSHCSDTQDDCDSSILGAGTTSWWNRKRSRANTILWGLAIVAGVVILAACVSVFYTKPNQNESSSSNNSNVDDSLDDNINQNHSNSSPPTTTTTTPPSITPVPLPVPLPAPLKELTAEPSSTPTLFRPPTYVPGNLSSLQAGLLLSEGLSARLLATTGNNVEYWDGSESEIKFHGRPDGGATFPDARGESSNSNSNSNPGGWIYTSNSEMATNGQGGVGALTFDADGNLIHYQMVLKNTTMNCGGGRTPWNTWISCEEVEFTGLIYQVDPLGFREAQVTTLGNNGGRWESFSYDIRDRERPYFFATEDHNKGTVRRFTPATVDWDNDPWNMLHGAGATDYLMIFPNATNNGGTFQWTNDLNAAKYNARSYYPQTEGIDVFGSQMFLVCKNIRQLFTINLDDGTYSNRTTISGLFDGKPDAMQRILGDSRDLLYFTEEGGVDAGVHARDHLGRFYTILESPVYKDETSGLSFSPDGRFLIVAYQENGLLFQVWRNDGHPFYATHLDVKYHRAESGR
jgi:hypothetical protein